MLTRETIPDLPQCLTGRCGRFPPSRWPKGKPRHGYLDKGHAYIAKGRDISKRFDMISMNLEACG